MTDHIPNDLSHLSNAEFHSLCPQGEHAPGPEPLSPAAQAAVKAVDHYETTHWLTPREVAAAALRAVADQVVPETKAVDSDLDYGAWEQQQRTRAEILAIANELEGIS
jgi:hypothetical protein